LALVSSVFLGVLFVMGLAMGPEKLMAKLEQKDPYRGRREMLKSSLRMIPDRPMMGVGIGNWAVAYTAYATFDDGFYANQAHNDWVQWAVEGGIPFALLMVAAAALVFPQAIRSGWGAGVAVVFLQCFVDYPIQRMGVAIVFFSLVGAIAASVSRQYGVRTGGQGFQVAVEVVRDAEVLTEMSSIITNVKRV
jgi:hypothetical protein